MHMQHPFVKGGLLLALVLGLAACQYPRGTSAQVPEQKSSALAPAAIPALQASAIDRDLKMESAQLLSGDSFLPGADRLVVNKKKALLVLAQDGRPLSRLPGNFGAIDHRIDAQGLLLAAVDVDRQQPMVIGMTAGRWSVPQYLPRPSFKVEGVCLYRDSTANAFLFLVGEEGLGEQWLVAHHATPLGRPQRVRALSLPPASEFCRVDDDAELLYVNEEKVGLWAYEAHAEADLVRYPVAAVKPFGDIAGSAAGMAVVPGGVLLLDAEEKALHRYVREGKKKRWQAQQAIALDAFDEPENLSARVDGAGLALLIQDERGLHRATLDWLPPAPQKTATLPVLPAQVQTDGVPSLGDAADDPAIWVHPTDPARSRVLATDKQGGLLVYDLQGRQLQDLRVGRLNNVDIRAGFEHKGRLIDLAVATNRDHDSLHLFGIDRSSGKVSDLGQQPTTLKDIYGICMFKDDKGRIHAIPNGKDGTFVQYRLRSVQGRIASEEVRRFRVGSQPEGCVADDRNQRLFVGEEDVAVWALDARADAPAQLEKVIGVGPLVHDDIEGLAFYRGQRNDYLVISSQGNNSYVVLDGRPPYAPRGAFRIGLDAEKDIDGVSETDGLEVTSANLGGIWQRGMLVVQDGRKRMPEGNQNYKYLPWSAVADALGLE